MISMSFSHTFTHGTRIPCQLYLVSLDLNQTHAKLSIPSPHTSQRLPVTADFCTTFLPSFRKRHIQHVRILHLVICQCRRVWQERALLAPAGTVVVHEIQPYQTGRNFRGTPAIVHRLANFILDIEESCGGRGRDEKYLIASFDDYIAGGVRGRTRIEKL